MLNDFGCAVDSGSAHLFAGTIRFAPTALLRHCVITPHLAITAQPYHDLESAVKLLWVCLAGNWRKALFRIKSSDTAAVLAFWTATDPLLPSSWLEAARTCNYNTLISL